MDQLTSNLRGVAVYLDDILVSGATAKEHLQNLRFASMPTEQWTALQSEEMFICPAISGVSGSHDVKGWHLQRS